jgi:UDP-N-acetylmuramate--alanine ligase
MEAFGPALAEADVVLLTDIYGAGEPAIPGISIDALAETIRPAVRELHLIRQLDEVPAEVARLARPGDLVITLGAGSIGAVSSRIVAALAEADAKR